MKLIAVFHGDAAAVNIRDRLLELKDWQEYSGFHIHGEFVMRDFSGEHLYAHDLSRKANDMNRKIDEIIVPSRHRSKSGKPTLTVHPTGNFSNADFGGRPGELSVSSPRTMAGMLRTLKGASSGMKYDVSMEVTHHGPLSQIPLTFIEIGSTDEEWGKREPAEAIAESILEPATRDVPVAIGIGGGHYAPRFSDLILGDEFDIGHIMPNYQKKQLTPEIIRNMVEKTPENKVILGYGSLKSSIKAMVGDVAADLGMDFKTV